jgi:YHS domain-containing protein
MRTWKKLGLVIAAGALGCTLAWAADEKKKPAGKDAYPLDTCVVSGEKLGGDMGEAVKYDHNGREVRFCCKGCIDTFRKDPDKYLNKLDEAAKAKAGKDASAKAPDTTTPPAKKEAGHEHH